MKILSKIHMKQDYMSMNRFEVITTERPITRDEQATIQTQLGYDPRGYGMEELHKELQRDGNYLNYWYCNRSAD